MKNFLHKYWDISIIIFGLLLLVGVIIFGIHTKSTFGTQFLPTGSINTTVPISTAYGQVLIGNNSGGGYTPVATTTIGMSSIGTTNVLQASNGVGGFIATGTPQLTVGNIIATSTTAINYFMSKIGIGTTSPQTPLEVNQSDTNTTVTTGNASAIRIVNTNTTNNNMSELSFVTNDTNGTGLRTSGMTGVNTSHTPGAMSGAFTWLTRNAGTYSEKMRLSSAGNLGIGTTSNTELLTIGRPASDNDYSTLAAWSGLVEGIFSASTPDLTVYAGSKTAHPFNLVTTNSTRMAITSAGDIQMTSNSLNFNKGGDSVTSNYKIYQTSDGYMQMQRSGGADDEFSIFDLEAPTADPIESTLTTGLNTGANRNWIDWTDEAYASDNAGSINIGAKGSAIVQPFVIRFWPKTTYTHVHDIPYGTWFDPSGAVAFGYGSTTATTGNPYRYDFTIPLQVASSTATTIFAVDTSPRTHIFQVNSNGNVGVGTTSPWRRLDVNGTVGMKGLTGSSGLQVGILCLSAVNEVINESVACVASAARYKENIKPLNVGLDELLKLKPISFNWKKDYNGALQSNPNFSGTQYSLVADDVQKVDKNLVTIEIEQTTFEGITYPAGTVHGLANQNTWIGLFTKSIQDLNAKVENIKIGKVVRSGEENWQDVLIMLLIMYVLYNEYEKQK